MTINVLTTNAVDLQRLLDENKTTSAQDVEEYLAQIDRYEPALNALISPAPRDKVLATAKARDEERQTNLGSFSWNSHSSERLLCHSIGAWHEHHSWVICVRRSQGVKERSYHSAAD